MESFYQSKVEFNRKMNSRRFPIYYQIGERDCGPTCLRMIAKYYGKPVSLDYLKNQLEYEEAGVSLLGLTKVAECIGFKSVGVKLTFEQLAEQVILPAILHWNQYHFVVAHPGSFFKRRLSDRIFYDDIIEIADPAKGLVKVKRTEFEKQWLSTSDGSIARGIALLMEKTQSFDNLLLENNISMQDEIPF